MSESNFALLDGIVLSRQRKPQVQSTLAFVRELGPGDREELENPRPQSIPKGYNGAEGGLRKMRHSHHLLARVLATGARPEKASLLSGYATSTIYVLQTDPTFQTLIEHYKDQTMADLAEVRARAEALGLSFLDEVQDRFDSAPESFETKELHKMAMDLLDRTSLPSKAPGGGAPSRPAAPPTLRVEFVESPRAHEPSFASRTIDVTAVEISAGGSDADNS